MGWPRSSRLTPLGLAAVLFAQACGSGTPGGSERGTIAFSLTPAAATLQVGGLVQVTGTIVRGGGFTGAVAITVEGAPTGVTGSLDAGTSITASTAVVRIGAGADAVPGTYQLTVRAKATGLTDATATFVLTVAPAASSYYLLTVDTSPLAVIQGTAVVTSIGILRVAGFAGSVTFTAEGLPAGVIAAFNPTAVTGLGTALTFTVGSSVVPGSYSIVIRGTVAGRTDVTAAVTLVVSASPTFSIAAGSNYLNVLQGNGGVTYVKASRSAGFTATASYTISGAPAGLGATIAATVVTDSLTLTVTTTAGLAPGTYPLVIHANATGIAERTTTVNMCRSWLAVTRRDPASTLQASSPAKVARFRRRRQQPTP